MSEWRPIELTDHQREQVRLEVARITADASHRRVRDRIERIGISLFAIAGAIGIGLPIGWVAAHLMERVFGP